MRYLFYVMCATFVLTTGLTWSTGAVAQQSSDENLALIIGNFDYDSMEDVPGQQDADRMERALRDNGFQVVRGTNLIASRQVGLARIFAERMDRADRVMVIFMGHVVSSGDDSFLLGVDAGQTDVLNAGRNGLSLTALQSLLMQRPGTAILMVAGNQTKPRLGRGLNDGFGGRDAKQGVTILRARSDTLSQVLIDGLLEPGNSLRQALPVRSGLQITGFVSDRVSFMGSGAGDEVSPDLGQLAYWNATRDIRTQEAYEAYLNRFPQGIFAGEARGALEELRLEPLREAQAAENAMNLNRDQRRGVQQILTNLGHDTRGVDGIFGRGTRNAISSWQKANNITETGYLDQNQFQLIVAQTAASNQAAAERAEQKQRQAQEAYNTARSQDTIRAYRRFLNDYPTGNLSQQARRRIEQIRDAEQRADRQQEREDTQQQDQQSSGNQRLLNQERIFTPNRGIRQAIERQLQRNGFNPGAVDGNIDKRTRSAIFQFQRSRGLRATGYLDASTVSLLAL